MPQPLTLNDRDIASAHLQRSAFPAPRVSEGRQFTAVNSSRSVCPVGPQGSGLPR